MGLQDTLPQRGSRAQNSELWLGEQSKNTFASSLFTWKQHVPHGRIRRKHAPQKHTVASTAYYVKKPNVFMVIHLGKSQLMYSAMLTQISSPNNCTNLSTTLSLHSCHSGGVLLLSTWLPACVAVDVDVAPAMAVDVSMPVAATAGSNGQVCGCGFSCSTACVCEVSFGFRIAAHNVPIRGAITLSRCALQPRESRWRKVAAALRGNLESSSRLRKNIISVLDWRVEIEGYLGHIHTIF